MRNATKTTGAAMPMDAKPGSRPIANVAKPIRTMVITKVYLRPTRSPRRPKTTAPSGRTAKPAAKLSKVKMNAAAGFTPEKKCLLISTAKAPTSKKSYHSNTVPREDANTTSLSLFVMATFDNFWVPSRAGASSIMSSPGAHGTFPQSSMCILARACPERLEYLQAFECLARPAGFEPTTPWFVARQSQASEAQVPDTTSLQRQRERKGRDCNDGQRRGAGSAEDHRVEQRDAGDEADHGARHVAARTAAQQPQRIQDPAGEQQQERPYERHLHGQSDAVDRPARRARRAATGCPAR